jgi:hypothetical protein
MPKQITDVFKLQARIQAWTAALCRSEWMENSRGIPGAHIVSSVRRPPVRRSNRRRPPKATVRFVTLLGACLTTRNTT